MSDRVERQVDAYRSSASPPRACAKPDPKYRRAWRKLRVLHTLHYGALLSLPVALVVVDFAAYILVPALVVYLTTALALFLWACPSCKLPYFWDRPSQFRRTVTLTHRTCVHCGLARNSEPLPAQGDNEL